MSYEQEDRLGEVFMAEYESDDEPRGEDSGSWLAGTRIIRNGVKV